ncbi:type I-E CRISPR-associated protein Cse2/CasB [Leptothoe sp. PORK10 BA2]|uniref:type I-E CRISPR-associated protein Cse2/CasB n=1 Tax=Leptothoe sp. PORK10 BA2 TaxID=3110254 RepID=UPI002B21E290|nr:type I-E CRISPR-associated protein Cse2/CasB [Leptothoe sp. PORK10 BA2]MEA5463890.1 type I-E CRISPR-associated protein Cse2/CasB [Leptothoe sp. PORK10 BA2]
MNEFEVSCRGIVTALFEKCQDRAIRSHLRQLLQDNPDFQMGAMRYLRDLPKRSKVNQELLHLISGLIAEYPCDISDEPFTLGASLAKLSRHPDTNSSGVERRFELLLQLERSSLAQQLHGLVIQAENTQRTNNPVRIDFAKLLYDLHSWDRPEKWVQLSWSRDFWYAKPDEEETGSNDIPD